MYRQNITRVRWRESPEPCQMEVREDLRINNDNKREPKHEKNPRCLEDIRNLLGVLDDKNDLLPVAGSAFNCLSSERVSMGENGRREVMK